MQDYADFDFTEEEIYRGLRLAVPDAEARRQAREAAAALGPGMDWATSEHLLLLLSLGSESAAAKVERIRRSEQEGRRSTWEAAERAAGRGDLARRWAELVAGEDRAWSERREALRRSLRAEGKLPP